MLYGRDDERAVIDRLLGESRDGRSGLLVLRGEAGIGKTALLEYAAERAEGEGARVLRATGVEYESGMPYAGLHMMLGRHLDGVGALPDPQARALRAALGMGGEGGDRFLVGLAVLTLLADLAEERPLAVLVDDAQWLDGPSAEALLFAGRRLRAERIALLLAAREPGEFRAAGLPELRVTGLDADAATRLLAGRAPELPRHVHHEVLTEAMGNPLALLEFPGTAAGSSAYERIRRSFAAQLAGLPEPSRLFVLLVAADDLGDVGVVTDAAARLGASVADLEPAERAGLLRTTADGRIEVRHPLVRSAAYGDEPLRRRLEAHRALAAAYGERSDGCHWAFHLARSVTGPDEEVARTLEETAEAERNAGGFASVAAMYESAGELSPDRGERGRRLAAAARAAADAGLAERAVELAARAEPELADPVARASLTLIRATLADEQDRTKEAYRLFADTAAAVADADPMTAGYLFFQAASAAANAGDLAAVQGIAERGAGLPNGHHLAALARVFSGQNPLGAAGSADGVAALRELIDGMTHCFGARDRVRAGMWHLMIGDVAGAEEHAARLERRFRDEGAIGLLPSVLMLRSRTLVFLGRHREALTAATEGLRIAADTGQHRIRVYLETVLALLAAIEGDEARCAELTAEALARGVPPSDVHAAAARSVLDLGAGRHEDALRRLAGVVAEPNRMGSISSLPDLVEAAVRSGRPDDGRDAAAWFAEWAAQVRQPWAGAVALRCEALLGPDEKAEDTYTRALELHRESKVPFERARTELLYGEWLRRARRRNDARAVLHAALERFERLGAAPWAERARTELRAAGESLGDAAAPDDLAARLTPQELQVVRMAATGLSNREIGAQLFLSPRTVGYHLYKAYPKLGVASRGELARLPLG